MRLEVWVKSIGRGTSRIHEYLVHLHKTSSLYVVGNCRECKFSENQLRKKNEEYNVCLNEKSTNYGICSEDGCIYFEKKEA